jgi:ATP-dependent Clp protease ATP-binding subunit ClpA
MKINNNLIKTIDSAIKKSSRLNYETLKVDHLLYELLENREAAEIFSYFNVDFIALKSEMHKCIGLNTDIASDPSHKMNVSPEFNRVIERAAFQAEKIGYAEVSGLHVILSALVEYDIPSVSLLNKNGITLSSAMNYLNEINFEDETNESENNFILASESFNHLENLTVKYQKSDLLPLIGRANELEKIICSLLSSRKKNIIIVGESGVGKTHLVESLAKSIGNLDAPKEITSAEILKLDFSGMIYGIRFKGDIEKKFEELYDRIKKHENPIIFIDEINVCSNNNANDSFNEFSKLIDHLNRFSNARCITTVSHQDYREIMENNPKFSRNFSVIQIDEPSENETIEIVMAIRANIEKKHNISYADEAIRAAVNLTGTYMRDRCWPEKAIDLLDQAAANQRYQSKNTVVITKKDIEKTINTIVKLPKFFDKENKLLQNIVEMEENIKLKIYGQEQAISIVCRAITVASMGMNDKKKPIGSFLFAGPTGVGKTELAKQVSIHLGSNLVRIDMSEYMEKHAVSKLIGSPPGYVGSDRGGILANAILKTPDAVLLLDEIEKAHPDITNILLQILDYGTLTDSKGRVIDFRRTIIIMTTNCGFSDIPTHSPGFVQSNHSSDSRKSLENYFSPELRNRIDSIIYFNALNQSGMENIVNNTLSDVNNVLKEKKITMCATPEAVRWLAQKAFCSKMGARPVERIIKEYIKYPITEKLIQKDVLPGQTILIDSKENELSIEIR